MVQALAYWAELYPTVIQPKLEVLAPLKCYMSLLCQQSPQKDFFKADKKLYEQTCLCLALLVRTFPQHPHLPIDQAFFGSAVSLQTIQACTTDIPINAHLFQDIFKQTPMNHTSLMEGKQRGLILSILKHMNIPFIKLKTKKRKTTGGTPKVQYSIEKSKIATMLKLSILSHKHLEPVVRAANIGIDLTPPTTDLTPPIT
jgi:hypothetical protein